MRSKISNPDSGVRGLKPHLYVADREWLMRTAMDEARELVASEGGASVSVTGYRLSKYKRLPRISLACAPDALTSATSNAGPSVSPVLISIARS